MLVQVVTTVKGALNRGEFGAYSILAPDDVLREQANSLLDGFESPPQDRAFGCLFGMAVGDAMAQRQEFQTIRYGVITQTDMGEGIGGAHRSCFPDNGRTTRRRGSAWRTRSSCVAASSGTTSCSVCSRCGTSD
jgi:hypothetical protein